MYIYICIQSTYVLIREREPFLGGSKQIPFVREAPSLQSCCRPVLLLRLFLVAAPRYLAPTRRVGVSICTFVLVKQW
jgi:hypothetical protein